MNTLPTITLQPVQHDGFYVLNGRLYHWDAIAQKSTMIMVISDYVSEKGE
jgi:hypothetical protein